MAKKRIWISGLINHMPLKGKMRSRCMTHKVNESPISSIPPVQVLFRSIPVHRHFKAVRFRSISDHRHSKAVSSVPFNLRSRAPKGSQFCSVQSPITGTQKQSVLFRSISDHGHAKAVITYQLPHAYKQGQSNDSAGTLG